MKKPKKTAKHTPAKKHTPKPSAKKPQRSAVKRAGKPKAAAVRSAAKPKPAPKAKTKAKVEVKSKVKVKAKPAPQKAPSRVVVPSKTKPAKPVPISVKKREPISAKPAPATSAKAPKAPLTQPKPAVKEAPSKLAAAETPVAAALKGKLIELQQRSALKRSRAATAFSFEEAADVLGSRRSQLKLFRTQESEAAKKVQKKEDLLPKIKQRSVGAASLDDILGIAPTKTVARAKKDPDIDSIPQKFRRMHKLLLEMRQRVSEGLDTRTKDTLKRSTKEDSGDLASYGPDSGTDTFDRDFALNLVSSEQDLLFEIEQAIQRLGTDSYGICEITGKPIPLDRLTAVPFTRYSLEGQKELESTSKVRKTYIERPTNLTETSEEDAPSYSDDGDDE